MALTQTHSLSLFNSHTITFQIRTHKLTRTHQKPYYCNIAAVEQNGDVSQLGILRILYKRTKFVRSVSHCLSLSHTHCFITLQQSVRVHEKMALKVAPFAHVVNDMTKITRQLNE